MEKIMLACDPQLSLFDAAFHGKHIGINDVEANAVKWFCSKREKNALCRTYIKYLHKANALLTNIRTKFHLSSTISREDSFSGYVS